MKRSSFVVAVAALSLAASAWAGGLNLHDMQEGESFRQARRVEFPPAVTKVLLQDGRATESWDVVDTRRAYCILEARSVRADRPTVLAVGLEHEIEFVDHKWLDLPYGAAYATSFHYEGSALKGMTCLKPSIYADDYMTLAEFMAVAGGFLVPVRSLSE